MFIAGSAIFVSLAYSAFWSFSIRKALFERIYRERALWTGAFAAYTAIEILVMVFFPSIFGTFAADFTWLVLGSVLLFVLTAWVSSTIRVVVARDPFNRNRLKWRQAEKLVWIASAVFVALNLVPVFNWLGYMGEVAGLGYVQAGLLIAVFAYEMVVLVAYQTTTYDRLLKAYLKSFFYLLVVYVLSIALAPVAQYFNLVAGPFYITDSLYILSALFLYKMSKSLAPVSIGLPKIEDLKAGPLPEQPGKSPGNFPI